MADCADCAARCNGVFADYCAHAAFIETHPGDGNCRPIPHYPAPPAWCPGHVAEDDDYEWEG